MAGQLLQELLTISTIRRATAEDVDKIVPILRQADRDEIAAASGLDPHECLTRALNYGANVAYDDDGGPVCMFGIRNRNTSVGYVWLIGTDGIANNRVEFLRTSRGIISGWNLEFPVLWTLSDARNEVHHKWLRWLNFRSCGTVEGGPQQLPFIFFIRENHV